jgi:hypothetical protein
MVIKAMNAGNTVMIPLARAVVGRSSPHEFSFDIPKYIKPGTKIDLQVEAISAANSQVSGGFYLRYDI